LLRREDGANPGCVIGLAGFWDGGRFGKNEFRYPSGAVGQFGEHGDFADIPRTDWKRDASIPGDESRQRDRNGFAWGDACGFRCVKLAAASELVDPDGQLAPGLRRGIPDGDCWDQFLLPWVFGILDPQTIEAYARIEGRFRHWLGQKEQNDRRTDRDQNCSQDQNGQSESVQADPRMLRQTIGSKLGGGGVKIGLQGFWAGSWAADYYPR